MRLALAAALVCIAHAAQAQDSFGGASAPQTQKPPQTRTPPPQAGGPQSAPLQSNTPGSPQSGDFARTGQFESRDFGVAPTGQLHGGAMHGPTPLTIPGGLVITTEALAALLRQSRDGVRVFDVLGGPEILPGAIAAVPASAPGSFSDQTQAEFGGFLQQVTGVDKQTPLEFY